MGLTFRTGALVDAIYTDSSNKVGIGTSTLTAGIPLSINVTTGNNCNVAFQENASDKWYLRNITSSNAFSFYSVAGSNEVMRLTSDSKVGINESTPLGTLHARGTANADTLYRLEPTSNNYASKLLISSRSSGDGGIRYGSGGGNNLDIFSYDTMRFYCGTANLSGAVGDLRMVITQAGNVGIGTSSPVSVFQVVGAGQGVGGFSGATYGIRIDAGGQFSTGMSTIHGVDTSLYGSYQPIMINGSDIRFGIAASEQMRIVNAGVLMNTTTVLTSGYLCIAVPSNNYNAIVLKDTGTTYSSANYYQLFTNSNNSIAGSVSHPTSGTTSFNTSSDYRLKEDFRDFSGLAVLANIKFYDFKWKDDNVRMYGVKAHEIDPHVPLAVSGVKDAVDEEGNIIAQGVDYSKIVPVIGKALQEAMERIEQLEAKVTALENR